MLGIREHYESMDLAERSQFLSLGVRILLLGGPLLLALEGAMYARHWIPG